AISCSSPTEPTTRCSPSTTSTLSTSASTMTWTTRRTSTSVLTTAMSSRARITSPTDVTSRIPISEECAAQDDVCHTEVDDEPGDIDQCCDQRCGRAGRVEVETAQDERQHRSGQRPEHDDTDEGPTNCRGDERPVRAIVIDSEVLPQRDADNAH